MTTFHQIYIDTELVTIILSNIHKNYNCFLRLVNKNFRDVIGEYYVTGLSSTILFVTRNSHLSLLSYLYGVTAPKKDPSLPHKNWANYPSMVDLAYQVGASGNKEVLDWYTSHSFEPHNMSRLLKGIARSGNLEWLKQYEHKFDTKQALFPVDVWQAWKKAVSNNHLHIAKYLEEKNVVCSLQILRRTKKRVLNKPIKRSYYEACHYLVDKGSFATRMFFLIKVAQFNNFPLFKHFYSEFDDREKYKKTEEIIIWVFSNKNKEFQTFLRDEGWNYNIHTLISKLVGRYKTDVIEGLYEFTNDPSHLYIIYNQCLGQALGWLFLQEEVPSGILAIMNWVLGKKVVHPTDLCILRTWEEVIKYHWKETANILKTRGYPPPEGSPDWVYDVQ